MEDYLKDPEVLRSIIMDNYQYPQNKSLVDDKGYHRVHMASDSCIDDLYIETKIEDGIIKDARFDGIGCTISTASASLMTQMIKGKTVEEAKHIMDEFYKMTNGQPYDANLLGEAVCFQNIWKQPNRIHCATIGWHGLDKLMHGENDDGKK